LHLSSFHLIAVRPLQFHLLISATPVGSSNYPPTPIPLLPLFTSLRILNLNDLGFGVQLVHGLASLRPCLRQLHVVGGRLSSMAALLSTCLGDQSTDQRLWSQLRVLKMQSCGLCQFDESIALLPAMQELNLAHNTISFLDHLQHCVSLRSVDLSFNQLRSLDHINHVLGNVTTLILRHNRLFTCGGLEKLYALEYLDLSNNLLGSIKEVRSYIRFFLFLSSAQLFDSKYFVVAQKLQVAKLSALPCVTSVSFCGNPIELLPKYRKKLLQLFRHVDG
jgi:Leucine-rich repeat (LRR) protein